MAKDNRPLVCRLIPTCMGNTVVLGYMYTLHTVNPHVHGEHVCLRISSRTVSG